MFGLENPLHILLVLLVVLLVFGAKRLPELGRSLGSGMREFKDSISGAVSADGEAPAPEPARLTAAAPEPAPLTATAAAPEPLTAPAPAAAPTATPVEPVAAPTAPDAR